MANKIIDLETSRLEISENTGLIVSVECFEKKPVSEVKEDIDLGKDTGLETGAALEMTTEEKAAFDAA